MVSMRVATFNVMRTEHRYAKRGPLLASVIETDLAPDVLMLQEVDHSERQAQACVIVSGWLDRWAGICV